MAKVADWEKIARTLEKAQKKFTMHQDDAIPFSQLGGMPVQSIKPNGEVTELIGLRKGSLKPRHMQPSKQSREVPLIQLMNSMKSSGRG